MTERTQLDYMYEREKSVPDQVWLTQPLGGWEIKTYTWAQAMDEARRMAAHIDTFGA